MTKPKPQLQISQDPTELYHGRFYVTLNIRDAAGFRVVIFDSDFAHGAELPNKEAPLEKI